MRATVCLLGFLALVCQAPAPEAPAPASAPDPLVNTVWVRSDEGGPPGEMRIFLADGTLVQDSCWEVYALRSWLRASEEEIVMIEDIEVSARILALSRDELRLSLSLVGGERQEVAYRRGPVPYLCPEMKK